MTGERHIRNGKATGPLVRFVMLYAALFAAYGVASPFLPTFLAERGLGSNAIAAVLAAGTAIRLVAAPLGCRLADRCGAPRAVLMAFFVIAPFSALLYLVADGWTALLLVSVLQAAILAPLLPIADALTLIAAGKLGFQYGWVRGAGSAAYILGTVFSGLAVGRFGLGAAIWLNAALLAAGAAVARVVPRPPSPAPASRLARGGMGTLLRLPWFRRLLLVAALVQGSHALHDVFAVIRWEAHGISPAAAGLLWSEAVAAEVIVFAGIGRTVLDRLGVATAAMVAAAAGVLRWGVLAETAWLPAAALVEPLHGATYALLHLACMRLIGSRVPQQLAATAQALYGTLAVGLAMASLTLASGPLYQHLGARSFWVMAALCAAALPLANGLRRAESSA